MNESVDEGRMKGVKEGKKKWRVKYKRMRKQEERMKELMDYKWLVPNVSGVFALFSL